MPKSTPIKSRSNTPSTLELSVSYVPISSLKLDPKNGRQHPKSQIRALGRSMTEFGWLIPITVDSEFNVVAGHARVLAALECGYDTAPVIQTQFSSEARRRAFAITDNRISEKATWNKKFVAEQFRLIKEGDVTFDLEVTGFDIPEIEMMDVDLLADRQAEKEQEELDPVVAHGPAVTRPGDLWMLDEHRILCGNSIEPSSFLALMSGKHAAAVFTDFPYNVKIAGHVTVKHSRHADFAMAGGEYESPQFTNFLTQGTALMIQNCQPGALLYQCMDWRHSYELLSANRALQLVPINMCVWVKPNPGMGSFYRSQHEIIHVFRNGKTPHRNNVQLGSYGRNRTNVWQYENPSSFGRGTDEGKLSTLHPTVKPVPMIRDALLDCTVQGDIVLDPFLGIGSTLIAAERCKRLCYGIEIEPAYVDATIRRWQVHSGGSARHAVTGKSFDEVAAERLADGSQIQADDTAKDVGQ